MNDDNRDCRTVRGTLVCLTFADKPGGMSAKREFGGLSKAAGTSDNHKVQGCG